MNEQTKQLAGLWQRFLGLFRATRVSVQRLSSDIEAFETRLEPRLRRASNQDWARSVRTHLEAAREGVGNRCISAGYESLLAAERDALPGLTPAERRARLASLREEAARKLAGSWRGRACEALLGDGTTPVSVSAMQEAMYHVHTRSQNTYHKLDLLRQQLRLLALILALLVFGSLLLAHLGTLDLVVPDAARLLPLAVLFGLLGGALSAMISVKETPPELKIPDSQRSALIALVRVLIGGAAAIPIYVLIEGQLINLTLGEDGVSGLMAFCFLGGFSERWFLGRIESLAGRRAEVAEQAAETTDEGAAETGGEGNHARGARRPSYRAGVGVVLCREDGKVAVGRRLNAAGDTWQFPQGGIENGETPVEAAARELHEELGVDPNAIELVHALPEPVTYDLPPEYRNSRVGLGQTQRWYLFRLTDKSVFEIAPTSEFSRLQWVALEDAVGLADDFRQSVYGHVVEEFLPHLPAAKKAAAAAKPRARAAPRAKAASSTKKKTAARTRTAAPKPS